MSTFCARVRFGRIIFVMIRQTVYFVPFSEEGLRNKLFEPFSNTKANVPPFDQLKAYLNQRDIEVLTIDYWDTKKNRDNDVVIVIDHPPVGIYKFLYRLRDMTQGRDSFPLKNRRLLQLLPRFKRKILMQWESPANNPWVYKNIKSITAHYDESYFIPEAKGYPHFYYPQNFDRLNEKHFEKRRKKFLVMMNTPSRAKGFFKNELYSKRVEALEFFSSFDEVDLYGGRWEKVNRPFIKKIWKGFADDKPATISEYTFALCFENAIWPGYVTEKIFDCMLVGTIPIYWGAPDIANDVPADCFIDMRKFKNYFELRAFLHALKPETIESYRVAIRQYFASENFKKFTPIRFMEKMCAIISKQEI
ncbi:MAG: hypothetical protein A3B25_02180 [Candidatus Ryanbacteria bacterium RIFCSPLOWO2_01_FULL_48_26]|uniref:Fucosyltransferase C-terminal domain-containing protein n=1 Tax=Candidatus Ryanbacteria bacterium RIFCSPLOWO2_01_FULL_48_26 TaxID=1802126 RepID=A0A1G2GT69_9BACT|nr:MAG: hypothetical protein A3B25_02180 [Candidatus Ryanbacteria bacterium RIFCSPLOWO2_01_FULL_48_26]